MPDSPPEGEGSSILDAVTGVPRHPGRWGRGVAAVVAPAHFVFGADKNIWYVDGDAIDRMTLDGRVTVYHAPGSNSGASSIAAGVDGRLWFVEGASGAATIGAIRPSAG